MEIAQFPRVQGSFLNHILVVNGNQCLIHQSCDRGNLSIKIVLRSATVVWSGISRSIDLTPAQSRRVAKKKVLIRIMLSPDLTHTALSASSHGNDARDCLWLPAGLAGSIFLSHPGPFKSCGLPKCRAVVASLRESMQLLFTNPQYCDPYPLR